MYCGHLAIGLAARPLRPRLPLWLLLVSAFGPDWLETAQIAIGVDDTPLWSHSIPAVAVGAIVAGAAVGLWRRSGRDAALVSGLYVSHLLLDYLTGRKPLGFGGLYLGARLYDHPLVDFALESGLIIGGWLIYRRSLPPEAGRRQAALYGMPLILIALQGLYDRFFAHG